MAKTKLVLSRPGKRSSGVAEDEERGSGGGSSTASWSSSSGASSSASSSSGQKLPKWFKPGKWIYGLTFWQLFNKLVCCSHVVLPSFKTAKPLWLLHSLIETILNTQFIHLSETICLEHLPRPSRSIDSTFPLDRWKKGSFEWKT